jgi:hypothetical protein
MAMVVNPLLHSDHDSLRLPQDDYCAPKLKDVYGRGGGYHRYIYAGIDRGKIIILIHLDGRLQETTSSQL